MTTEHDRRSESRASLANMMDVAPAGETLWEMRDLQAIFQHQLAAPLAVDLAHIPAESVEAGMIVQKIETFGQLLHHPHPPLDALRRVKEFAKRSRTDPDAPLPAETATLLYFAAITAARVRLNQGITALDDAALMQSMEWCIARSWIDPDTRELFQAGLRQLQQAKTQAAARLTSPPSPGPG